MERETRTFEIELAVEERAEGRAPSIVGHAAVFNSLSENLGGFRERIAPGAFAESINADDVRALFNHDPNFVLGRNKAGTLELSEDDHGLAIRITPPDTSFARDLMVSLGRRDITQMSFGFTVLTDGQAWEEDADGMVVRTLKRVRLFDVSPVTYPAYTQTDVALRELRSWQAANHAPELWRVPIARRRLSLIA